MKQKKIDEETFIRKAVSDDAEHMKALDDICFSHPWTQGDFDSELNKNKVASYYVLENSTSIIGYAGIWWIVDEGHITNFAVHPDFRKKGYGEEMLKYMIGDSKSQGGINSFTLEVRKSNEAAISLYEKNGFIVAGERPEYYADDKEDAYIMWMYTGANNEGQ